MLITDCFASVMFTTDCVVFRFSVALCPRKNIRLIRDMGPRTATSIFSRSSSVLLCVHRDDKDYEGQRTHNGHLDFHTASEL